MAIAGSADASGVPDCTGASAVTRYYWRTGDTRPLGCDLSPPQTLTIRVPVRDHSDTAMARSYRVLMHYGCAPQARLRTLNGQLFEIGDRCDY